MNIAILIPELGGGGAERVAQIIGDYYYDKGENVYYFLGDTTVKQVYSVKGVVINIGIKGSAINISYGDIQILEKLLKSSLVMRKYKREYHIDVAISFMEEFNYLNILSKGKEKVITRVCTILSQRKELKGFLYHRHVIRFFYNLSDKVIVMSDYAREDMCKKYGISYRRMQKIPNPALRYDEESIKEEWKYGRQAIVCVGRLEHVKQHERIIRAFSYVKSQEKEAKLLILGTGPNKIYLENVCEKWKVQDSVYFIGFTEHVGFYLKHCKVFVMASRAEGFPNSMVEAMAYGVPVVTTDSPGACGEIVGKRKCKSTKLEIQYCNYGILTPNISETVKKGKELAKEELLLGKALEHVLSNEELYRKYSLRSRKRAMMYNREKIMSMWGRLIEN